MKPTLTIIVMGVSGCGKTTVAQALAEATGGLYVEGDDFHPPANRAKMAGGTPLSDEDRWGWLDALSHELRARQARHAVIFVACSALAQRYRDRLATGLADPRFVYLKITFEEALRRLLARRAHFMPPALLASQFETLEEPQSALTLDARAPVDELVTEILGAYELLPLSSARYR